MNDSSNDNDTGIGGRRRLSMQQQQRIVEGLSIIPDSNNNNNNMNSNTNDNGTFYSMVSKDETYFSFDKDQNHHHHHGVRSRSIDTISTNGSDNHRHGYNVENENNITNNSNIQDDYQNEIPELHHETPTGTGTSSPRNNMYTNTGNSNNGQGLNRDLYEQQNSPTNTTSIFHANNNNNNNTIIDRLERKRWLLQLQHEKQISKARLVQTISPDTNRYYDSNSNNNNGNSNSNGSSTPTNVYSTLNDFDNRVTAKYEYETDDDDMNNNSIMVHHPDEIEHVIGQVITTQDFDNDNINNNNNNQNNTDETVATTNDTTNNKKSKLVAIPPSAAADRLRQQLLLDEQRKREAFYGPGFSQSQSHLQQLQQQEQHMLMMMMNTSNNHHQYDSTTGTPPPHYLNGTSTGVDGPPYPPPHGPFPFHGSINTIGMPPYMRPRVEHLPIPLHFDQNASTGTGSGAGAHVFIDPVTGKKMISTTMPTTTTTGKEQLQHLQRATVPGVARIAHPPPNIKEIAARKGLVNNIDLMAPYNGKFDEEQIAAYRYQVQQHYLYQQQQNNYNNTALYPPPPPGTLPPHTYINEMGMEFTQYQPGNPFYNHPQFNNLSMLHPQLQQQQHHLQMQHDRMMTMPSPTQGDISGIDTNNLRVRGTTMYEDNSGLAVAVALYDDDDDDEQAGSGIGTNGDGSGGYEYNTADFGISSHHHNYNTNASLHDTATVYDDVSHIDGVPGVGGSHYDDTASEIGLRSVVQSVRGNRQVGGQIPSSGLAGTFGGDGFNNGYTNSNHTSTHNNNNNNNVIPSAVEFEPEKRVQTQNMRDMFYYLLVPLVCSIIVVFGVSVSAVFSNVFAQQRQRDAAIGGRSKGQRDRMGIQLFVETHVPESVHTEIVQSLHDHGTHDHGSTTHTLSAALDWITFHDELCLEPTVHSNFLQRFALASIYYSTSMNRPWDYCSYPDNNMGCYTTSTVTDNNRRIPNLQYRPTERSWLSPYHECLWAGVTCDSNLQVREITISGMGMTGAIPDMLGMLPFVTNIEMSKGKLQGSIPETVMNMKHLHRFEINDNEFTGTIPNGLFTMRNLHGLYMKSNKLQGELVNKDVSSSDFHGKDMKALDLGKNKLFGSIPSLYNQLSSISTLYLDHNNLVKSIPDTFMALQYIDLLNLEENRLSGSIPSIMPSSGITQLSLGGNTLDSGIPPELYSCTQLQVLELDGNQLQGSISTSIGQLQQLQVLKLNDNNFYGTVPDELGNLSVLQDVSLSLNKFWGPIPSSVCELRGPYELQSLDADCLDADNTTDGTSGDANIICPIGCCTICCDPKTKDCKDMKD